jgi:hypothetical protein
LLALTLTLEGRARVGPRVRGPRPCPWTVYKSVSPIPPEVDLWARQNCVNIHVQQLTQLCLRRFLRFLGLITTTITVVGIIVVIVFIIVVVIVVDLDINQSRAIVLKLIITSITRFKNTSFISGSHVGRQTIIITNFFNRDRGTTGVEWLDTDSMRILTSTVTLTHLRNLVRYRFGSGWSFTRG